MDLRGSIGPHKRSTKAEALLAVLQASAKLRAEPKVNSVKYLRDVVREVQQLRKRSQSMSPLWVLAAPLVQVYTHAIRALHESEAYKDWIFLNCSFRAAKEWPLMISSQV